MEEQNISNWEDEPAEEAPAADAADSVNAPAETAPAEQDAEHPPETIELPDEELRAIIEVFLLVYDRPLSVSLIREMIGGISQKKIQDLILRIRERLAEGGFPYQVREVGGGYVLSTLPEYSSWVRKLYSPKAKISRLSPAALETLAVVAYKQPVTRAEIEAIRGVSVDSTLKTLLDRHLCEIVGYKDVIGKPATYGTTNEFLLHFGLNTLNDLPSIEELRRSDADS